MNVQIAEATLGSTGLKHLTAYSFPQTVGADVSSDFSYWDESKLQDVAPESRPSHQE